VRDARAAASDSVSVMVRPRALVDASFTFEADATMPGKVTFRAAAPDGTATWDFGDDSPPATGLEVTHTYAEPGDYEVQMERTTTAGETASATQPLSIQPAKSREVPAQAGPWLAVVVGVGAMVAALGAAGVFLVLRRRKA